MQGILPASTVYSAYRSLGRAPLLRPDFSIDDCATVEDRYYLTLFDSLEEALDDGPDLVVVSTPSALHMDAMLEAVKRGVSIFVEKPVSHNLERMAGLLGSVIRQRLSFFISLQRRFNPAIRKVRQLINSGSLGDVVSADFHVASYLPDWHPYEPFTQLYAARQELGGGVRLTEIHCPSSKPRSLRYC